MGEFSFTTLEIDMITTSNNYPPAKKMKATKEEPHFDGLSKDIWGNVMEHIGPGNYANMAPVHKLFKILCADKTFKFP